MFRDLEEYQKLQKLYEEKVSKPKQLDEFTGLGVKGAVKQAQELKSKQGSSFGDSVKMGEKLRSQNNNNTTTSTTTTETPKKRFQSRFGKKQEPVKSPMEAGMGDGAARARAMAKARIGSGTAKNPDTTIAQANQKNQDAMRERARARNAAFKAKRLEFKNKKNNDVVDKKETTTTTTTNNNNNNNNQSNNYKNLSSNKRSRRSNYSKEQIQQNRENLKNTILYGNKDGKKERPLTKQQIMRQKLRNNRNRQESYDAYDVVLEYLLTSQQAATIEEANYIMTEMDAKTIQDIVSQQLNEQN